MNYLKSLTALVFIFSTQCCMSQEADFEAGFYINHRHDTVKGFLAVKKSGPGNAFGYKPAAGSRLVHIISSDSCMEISAGDVYYVNWFGTRNMSYIDKFDFTIKNQDSVITALIPLKLLYRGSPLSLFYFRDIIDHYFVQSENKIEELSISYRYLTTWEKTNYLANPSTPSYYTNAYYRDQIKSLMKNILTRKQKNIIDNASFDQRALMSLFKTIDITRKN
jgi:hypothetical protein